MEVIVKKPTEEELKELGVDSWGIWEKEVSTFDWEYADKETCYLLEGKVIVKSEDGKDVLAEFGKGDLVVFPKGLKCIWEIKEAVKKHFQFGG